MRRLAMQSGRRPPRFSGTSGPRALLGLLLSLGALGLAACGPSHDDHQHEESHAWAVTAWGDHFEVFAEGEPLSAGATVDVHTHVTVLEGFSPLADGRVSIGLRGAGAEAVFTAEEPIRDGVYSIPLTPERPGELDILCRVETPDGAEEIPVGRVRIADSGGEGGGLVEAAPLSARAARTGGAEAPISFTKEQQWSTDFATDWVAESTLAESLRAAARIRPVAGGEVLLTAPVDGVLAGRRWPFGGLDVDRGRPVFEIVPRVDPAKSLAELGAASANLESELEVARSRRMRLEELLARGAASQAEVERARSLETVLAARADAARRDLATARSTREGADPAGDATGEMVSIRAPFPGRVAEVLVTPGQTVEAGEAMARLVRSEPVWIEVRLSPRDAARLPDEPAGVVASGPGFGVDGSGEIVFGPEAVRLVSVSPGVDAKTGTVEALLEVSASVDELRLGSVGEVEILLGLERSGIVVPDSALIDDAGVTVVYVQLGGEEFARVEVGVVAKRSGRALVEGLPPGSRLVTVGGTAIRRASLVSANPEHGHIH